MYHLFKDVEALKDHILHVLAERKSNAPFWDAGDTLKPSSVLFLLGQQCHPNDFVSEPCLILNKRSDRVKQPGDLCFPGGSLAPRLDPYLAKLITLPVFPMARWPHWERWVARRPQEARRLALFFATSLRESFEEMGLNPLGVKFLGPLPSQRLRMFRRVIYPMVGWVSRQKRFFLNWEVDKVIFIPLRCLLNPVHYARYRLRFGSRLEKEFSRRTEDFPCFRFRNENETELLWGVTYRIVMIFLELSFGFKPPDPASLPVISGILKENYLTGPS